MTAKSANRAAGPAQPGKAAALATVLVAVGLALCGTSARDAEASSLTTGVTDPLTTYDAPPLAYRRIRAAGARYVRLTIGWTEVAPVRKPSQWDPSDPADPNYWWPNADRQVVNAVNAGLTPVIAVTGAPEWAQGCDRREYPSAVCDLNAAAYARFATAIARRYSGAFQGLPRVRHWQAQNEPNLSLFFNPQLGADGRPVSPDLYRALLVVFSAAVKSVHRSNLVVGAGLGPLGYPGAVSPLDFARRLLCMRGRRPTPRTACRGGVPLDVFAINPYTTGGPTHRAAGPDDLSLGKLGKLQRLLRAADRAGRMRGAFRRTPLWITEFGWDSRPPDPGGLRPALHARWTSEALFRAWRAGVHVFFWYGLRDEARQGRRPAETVESGLYLRGPTLPADRPKPALRAFRFPFVALARRGGFLVWGRTPDSRRGRVRIQVRRGGRWRGVAALRAGRHGIFERRLAIRYSKRGSVRAVYGKQRSLPFSLRYVADFYQPPFG